MADDDKFPSDAADRFQVRMPTGMRDRVAEAAKANNRSMNAEIVERLERSFDKAGLSEEQPEVDHDLLVMAASEGALRAVSEIVSVLNKFRGNDQPANMQDVLADVLWDIEENRKANSPYFRTSRNKKPEKEP